MAAGAAAGLAGGLFGVGGGLVLVPILTGVFHTTQHEAHGTSLAVIGATAITALFAPRLGYVWHGDVAWTTGALVALSSIFTARWGARWAKRTSPRGLARAFAAFLVVVALRLLWRVPHGAGVAMLQGGIGVVFDLALGAAVGVTAGYMGVGGGILAVPAFTLLLGMGQQAAQGTSLAIILVTAPAGAIEHSRHGNVRWALVPLLALGAIFGGPAGSALAHQLDQVTLARTFAVFLLFNAVHIWRRAGRRPAAPPEPTVA